MDKMRKGWLFALIATVSLASPATAEIRYSYRSGAWSAFEGIANDGKQVCGVSAASPDKAISLKYFAGTDYITVHISKNSWSIPERTRINIQLQFGQRTPWDAVGQGNGNLVEFIIRGRNINIFIQEFRASSIANMRFIGGNENGWTISLAGSNAATNVMTRCVGDLITAQRAPTQPFSSAPATPSQPFVPSSPSTGQPRLVPASPPSPGKDI
jgi:hypothetical protein